MRGNVTKFFLFIMLCIITAQLQAQMPYSFSATTGNSFSRLGAGTAFTWTTTTANDEEYSAATAIGFSFNYAGTSYTDFQVSTNGFLRFGTNLASATATDALSGVLRQIVAPLWNDLAVTATATDITYLLSGTTPNQVLTVEWQNVKWNKTATDPNMNFQVKLYEGTNNIEFCYGYNAAATSGSASIGLSDNTVIPTAGQATGKYLSLNVCGIAGARVFNGIFNAPDSGTVFTFLPVTSSTPMTGSYTVGGSTPDFATPSLAAMALNQRGISGPVEILFADGVYDDIFYLINVAGTSATNTITIGKVSGSPTLSPTNGSVTSSAPGQSAGDHVIRLDGTQFVIIDGINIYDNDLNITTATKFEAGIGLYNSIVAGTPSVLSGARFNIIKNLTINMRGLTGAFNSGSTGIRMGTVGSAVTDTNVTNSYNMFQDITVKNIFCGGIKMYGHNGENPDRMNQFQR
ncbi:MAG: hypothetical protein HYV28_03100 [Ignavibacteriales bacterium]|nr:hypothetical protein [Ignavibacteriales bacterium]